MVLRLVPVPRRFPIYDEALDVTNRDGLVEMSAHASLFAEVVANSAQGAGQRIVSMDNVLRCCDVITAHLCIYCGTF